MRRKKPIVTDAEPVEFTPPAREYRRTWLLWLVLGIVVGAAGAYLFAMYSLLTYWNHS